MKGKHKIHKLFFLLILFCVSSPSVAHADPDQDEIAIVTPELGPLAGTGGLREMLGAHIGPIAEIANQVNFAKRVVVYFPFYMSFYLQPGLVESFTDEHSDIEVKLDYHYDVSSGEMVSRRTERFHIFSLQLKRNVKVLFYRHMNREGERNYFDNKPVNGQRVMYAPADLEKEAFGAVSKAVATDILLNRPRTKIVDVNEWHMALTTYFLNHPERLGAPATRLIPITYITHNNKYQGDLYDDYMAYFDKLGIDTRDFHPQGLAHGSPNSPDPRRDHFNSTKTGMNYSDVTSTVSIHYLREILEASHGEGLEEANRELAALWRLTAHEINGVDTETWNPQRAGTFVADLVANQLDLEKNRALYTPDYYEKHRSKFMTLEELQKLKPEDYDFSIEDVSGKARGKSFFQNYLGLNADPDATLSVGTARVDGTKGYESAPAAIREVLTQNPKAQFVVIGDSGPEGKEFILKFKALTKDFPGRFRYHGFTNDLENIALSFADLAMAFSNLEPAGRVHLISMLMLTIPMANATGGHQVIIDVGGKRTGFLTPLRFKKNKVTVDADAMVAEILKTMNRAIGLHQDHPEEWLKIMQRAGAQDFSVNASASAIVDRYRYVYRRGPEKLLAVFGRAGEREVYTTSELLKLLDAAEIMLQCRGDLHAKKSLQP
jgi:glycogen synthase